MLKKWKEFNEELMTQTYADILNRTESYPWVKFLGDKLGKSDKMESVNYLAKELFTREFLKEFEPGLTIKNGNNEFIFSGIKFNTNYTNYNLQFTNKDKTGGDMVIHFDPNDIYYIKHPIGIVDNLDDDSKSLISDMFKYMRS